ncbi:ATP-binding protein [Streptomyces sp. NRRL F-4489]|uniref:ATP-binding protein n=1 Tax=Streptomyces sp. NRRL F-4489 TaxID=1609095 RepID=UPI000A922AFA|nr:ATP-binding protein [Streptomyces sp. NRRL F-4489]
MLPSTQEAGIHLTARQVETWPGAKAAVIPSDRWRSSKHATFSLPPLERSVPVCRALVRAWLDGQRIRGEDTRYLVLLVLSELVTNAIQHSGTLRVTCRLRRTADELSIEVHDGGGTPWVPRRRSPDPGQERGRGLDLVARSCTRWGRRTGPDNGCVVWAAVPLSPGAPAGRLRQP